jgi:hypothetical protein
MKERKYRTSRSLMGGCYTCHGDEAKWFSRNTQGLAAQHHDKTGHPTWVDIALSIQYGGMKDGAR